MALRNTYHLAPEDQTGAAHIALYIAGEDAERRKLKRRGWIKLTAAAAYGLLGRERCTPHASRGLWKGRVTTEGIRWEHTQEQLVK